MHKNKGFGKKHPSAKEKTDIVKLYKSGSSVEKLSELFRFHPMTIYRWLREKKSKKSFKRSSNPGSGRNCRIEGVNGKKLINLLKHSATKYGFETPLWNTKRIEVLCKKELDLKTSHMTVWRFLNKMDHTCKKVQKTYVEADPRKQKEWKTKTIVKIKKLLKPTVLYYTLKTNLIFLFLLSWELHGLHEGK